ncbi:MAG: hypothetical protein RI934_1358 [Bacteroidota bacterium]|jgi:hypothetical protein
MKKIALMLALVAATSMVALAGGDGKCCSKDAAKAATKKACCSKEGAEKKACGDKAKTTSPAPKN